MDRKNYSDQLAIAAHQNVKEREFWLNKLSGEPVKSYFPYDSNRVHTGKSAVDKVTFSIAGEVFAQLVKLGKGGDHTLHIILTAGLVVLLDKYSYNGSKDIIVGSPIYKQNAASRLINTILALRIRLKRDMAFKELLFQVKETIVEAVEHQNYPIEMLVESLDLPGTQNGFPLFDVVVSLENIHDNDYVRHIEPNMIFSFFRKEREMAGTVTYNRSLYEGEAVERIVTHFRQLMEKVLFKPDVNLAGVDVMSEDERNRILYGFNDTAADYPREKSVFHFTRDFASLLPGSLCLGCKENAVTYYELNKRVDFLTHLLKMKGMGKDKLVGILMERSPLMAESILAVWKSGGAYIPLDVSSPVLRTVEILNDADAFLLLTESHQVTRELEEKYDGEILKPGEITGKCLTLREEHSSDNFDMSSLAYVIYTSGSTGKPKGVMVEHAGMMNHIYAKCDDLEITESSIIAQNASITFDISVWQFFSALVRGGRTVIYPHESVLDVTGLLQSVKEDRISILEVVPSYLSEMLTLLEEKYLLLDYLKYLVVTGETANPSLIKRWFNIYPGIKMLNAYGPTEASDDITHYIMDRCPGTKRIYIGKPVANFNIYIVNECMQLCPVGVKGEICVSGTGVGRGYLNDKEKTRQVFVNDPFTAGARRMYKTGDLGCWTRDGNIDFFGRKDYQVKIRGFRIELGEIESRLLNREDIKEAVVIEREDNRGEKTLCAYFVPRQGKDPGPGIRDYLSENLPAYMIPSYFVEMEKLPLTANGKIDKRTLPEPGSVSPAGYLAPTGELEKKLAGIWSEVLNIKKEFIGVNSNFFDLGGHSLRAMALVSNIHKELYIEIPLLQVFKAPTIGLMAEYIGVLSESQYTSVKTVEKSEYYRLSSAQKRLYIIQQMDLASTAYNTPLVLNIGRNVDKERIIREFDELFLRHESFRTSFRMVSEEPVQVISDHAELRVEYHEAKNVQHGAGNRKIKDMINRFVRPFDLSKAPLCRVGIVENSGNNDLLLVDMHHIISDGVSQEVLIEEFLSLYKGEDLPGLRIQYKDYSEWLAGMEQVERVKKQESFWQDTFSDDIPLLDLPLDFRRPTVQSDEGANLHFELAREDTQKLNMIAAENDATLFIVILSIYNIMLAKLSSRQDMVIGSPVACRRHADLESIIGIFVNTIAFRNFPAGDKTYKEFLVEVRRNALDAFENQEYPFEQLIDKLSINRDSGRNPFVEVMFVSDNRDRDSKVEFDRESFRPAYYENRTSKFDLSLFFTEGDTLYFSFEYRTTLFKKQTINRFITYFKKITSQIVKNINIKLSSIEIVSRKEKEKIETMLEREMAGIEVDLNI